MYSILFVACYISKQKDVYTYSGEILIHYYPARPISRTRLKVLKNNKIRVNVVSQCVFSRIALLFLAEPCF